MLLDIIIVNWNSGPLLERCIRSIYQPQSEIDFKIIIVDNNSDDGSTQNLPLKNRETVIKSESNLGFAKACNLAAGGSDSDFLLFLNPDTIVSSTSLESAILFLSSSPETGIAGVRQESENGDLIPSCSRFLRLRFLLNDILGLSKLFPGKIKSGTIMVDWDHNKSMVVDQVMGSFMLMRRSDFTLLGGFDERFFLFFEDMDLAKRLLTLGKKSFYLNDVKIIHTGCGTSNSVKDRRLFYSLSSRIKYARKHLSRIESFFITLLTIFPEPLTRVLYSLFVKRSLGDALSTIKGYLLLWGWLLTGK
ncbi:MAG: glycosyltransferase family 2 protein [Bacteroidales bacterium]|nr:glycosyltransferase family 2 protein [Bacteroidales bacterium]